VRIRLGSNTTIVGLGRDATIRGAWFDIRGTAGVANSRTNIIVRNLTFQDTFDCFPAWAPTDGALGSWNSQYDSISLRDSNNVWVDHNTFEDRATADETLPLYFGVVFQVHDGLVDITNASDLVTVSWNRFRNHDKTMLIGSSDTAAADRGKLRVTLHHNLFDKIGQRAPRVRFGQVHVYNNLYLITDLARHGYSLGVGHRSRIFSQSNAWEWPADVSRPPLLRWWGGDVFADRGSLLNGRPIDLLGLLRDAHPSRAIDGDVGWTPAHVDAVDPAREVADRVRAHAGAGRL